MKEAIKNFIIALFGLCLGILTTILVMIKGWGLQPKSWWWIIGVYLIGHTISHILIRLGQSKE